MSGDRPYLRREFRLEDLEASDEKEQICEQVMHLRQDLLLLEKSFRASFAKEEEIGSLKLRLAALETSIQQVAESVMTRRTSCCTLNCELF